MTAVPPGSSLPAVLITGCSSGIGRACAIDLVSRNWLVFAGVRRVQDGEELQSATKSERLRPLVLDVTSPQAIRSAVDKMGEQLGERGLDGLVNNAGIVVPGPMELVTSDQFRQQLEVNVLGTHAVTCACLPLLRLGRGRIVNMGSISGRITPACYGAYAASKHALEALNDAWRLELRPWQISVSIIEPDAVATPIWDKVSTEFSDISSDVSTQTTTAYSGTLRSARRSGLAFRKEGMAPAHVVNAVRHALTATRPRSHYPVGLRTRAAFLASKLLPTRIMDWVLQKSTGGST
jgi:NAD(P)-dependent dehydrogenase (short-subunit alcohol dehydrogenase family)